VTLTTEEGVFCSIFSHTSQRVTADIDTYIKQ